MDAAAGDGSTTTPTSGSRKGPAPATADAPPAHESSSLGQLQDQLKRLLDASPPAPVPALVTGTFAIASDAIFRISRPPAEGAAAKEEASPAKGGDGTASATASKGRSRASPTETEDITPAQVLDERYSTAERTKHQRGIAKVIVAAIGDIDGFRYGVRNEWESKKDGHRFQYACQDSLQNKDRKRNKLRVRKAGAEEPPETPDSASSSMLPTYDCGGLVTIKFSTANAKIDVIYGHAAIHRTVASRRSGPTRKTTEQSPKQAAVETPTPAPAPVAAAPPPPKGNAAPKGSKAHKAQTAPTAPMGHVSQPAHAAQVAHPRRAGHAGHTAHAAHAAHAAQAAHAAHAGRVVPAGTASPALPRTPNGQVPGPYYLPERFSAAGQQAAFLARPVEYHHAQHHGQMADGSGLDDVPPHFIDPLLSQTPIPVERLPPIDPRLSQTSMKFDGGPPIDPLLSQPMLSVERPPPNLYFTPNGTPKQDGVFEHAADALDRPKSAKKAKFVKEKPPTSEKRKRATGIVRSRNGCTTCRQRRIKCDEGHPVCINCSKSHRDCTYSSPVVTSAISSRSASHSRPSAGPESIASNPGPGDGHNWQPMPTDSQRFHEPFAQPSMAAGINVDVDERLLQMLSHTAVPREV